MGGPQPTKPPDPSIAEFERCLKVKESGNLADTRNTFEEFITQYPDSPGSMRQGKRSGTSTEALFFGCTPTPRNSNT